MDKELILAVAGSGKTRYLIDKLDLEKRFLIFTYTIENTKTIQNRILRKFGYIPENIHISTYFSFLYAFCFNPIIGYKYRATGIFFEFPPESSRRFSTTDLRYYMTPGRKFYSNRIAKFIESQGILQEVNTRIEKYFDCILIDEVQDFGGHDFNFIQSIAKVNVAIIAVGDFYQHTYDSSRDGPVRKNLHKDYENYKKEFEKIGFTIKLDALSKSYRCSPSVCKYISEELGISIGSNKEDDTRIHHCNKQEDVDQIMLNDAIVKLFYQGHYKYKCHSKNWGECKGNDDYQDVCVVLNKETHKQLKIKPPNLKPLTRNKLYVACSRAHRDLYFISEALLSSYKI